MAQNLERLLVVLYFSLEISLIIFSGTYFLKNCRGWINAEKFTTGRYFITLAEAFILGDSILMAIQLVIKYITVVMRFNIINY